MNGLFNDHRAYWALALGLVLAGAGCSSSGGGGAPPPPAAQGVTVNGIVSDGPVAGGTLFVFAADQVAAALDAVEPGGDRQAALAGADPLASLSRDAADEDQFELELPAAAAGSAVFFIFDNTDAEDLAFRDTPPNLESLAILGAEGTAQRVNVTLHTTLMAQQVRAQLPLDTSGVEAELLAAEANVLAALGRDRQGRDLLPADSSPLDSEDADALHDASSFVGFLARSASALHALELDAVIEALAADAADGEIDGLIPVNLAPSPELEATAALVNEVESRGDDADIAVFAVGPCSSSAVALRQACGIDVLDDLFEERAVCADTLDDDARAECLAGAEAGAAETDEECEDVFQARLELCGDLDDAAHEPEFGPAFAANFADPLEIGGAVAPNPYFPLVPGNEWIYEGTFLDEDGEEVTETITVTVTDEIKLIDGIRCVTVKDIVVEDGVLIEDTDDWYAQAVNGDVWYCGEVARNYESFEGDVPEEPELVDLEGSWKAGRDGAKPGVLLPAAPELGAVIRQEVSYGEAEDVVEIVSLTATENAPGGACVDNCLQTRDFTPLEPDVSENKYYLPGVGLILEVDPETGDRVELMQFNPAP